MDTSTAGTTGEELNWCVGFDAVYWGDLELRISADKLPLMGVECVAGGIMIHDAIGDLLGLESIVRVEGGIGVSALEYPGTLSSMAGLNNLQYAGGLAVTYSEISSLAGLEALEELSWGGLFLYANPNLHELSGLAALYTIEGSVALGSHVFQTPYPGLQDLGGLQALRTVGIDLEIVETSLTDLDELAALESVGGYALITFNKLLPSCEAKELLDGIIVGETQEYSGNKPDACDP